MLRSLAILGVSRQFALDCEVIDQEFIQRLRIIELLENTSAWAKPCGLYMLGRPGQQFKQKSELQIAPLLRTPSNELVGIFLNIQGGLNFALLVADKDVAGTPLAGALYRPSSIAFAFGNVRNNTVCLSWDDDHRHEPFTFTAQP